MESVAASRGTMPMYVARPDGDELSPGVVVIHDALGMSTDLRNQADWLATEGFVAAAPDLYYWGRKLRCVISVIRDAGRGSGPAFDDLDAARRWLLDQPECNGSAGVIGFCMGGGFAVLLAPTGSYDAASVNYGTLPGDAESLLASSCPIVASYGARDLSLRRAGPQLEQILSGHGIPHDVKVYPEAGHAFLNDHSADSVPWPVTVLGWASRSAHHEPSAADARARIVDFFRTHLAVE